jgi:hypothetical protein
MPLIAQVAAEVVARPLPLLCLDTCDLLDVIQSVSDRLPGKLEYAGRILAAATGPSPSVLLASSFLIPIEFAQNVTGVVDEVVRAIQDTDDRIEFLISASLLAGLIPPASIRLSALDLPAAVRSIAGRILSVARVLDRDATCVDRALERVVRKDRPSHRGGVKDSVHLEHYLELARHVRALGATSKIAFASANSDDFWEGKKNSDLHHSLRSEFGAVDMRFFGSWQAACGWLGI